MSPAALRQVHPDVHIVDPGPRPASGVEIEEPPSDEGDITVDIDADGGISITAGAGNPEEEKPRDTSFDANLAESLNESALDAIAGFLLDGIEADLQSRRDWEDTANLAANYLGIKLTDPATSVSADGTVCQSIATTLLEANLKLWGTARGELLPVTGPVKTRRDAAPATAVQAPPAAGPIVGMPPAASQGGIAANAPPGVAGPQGIAANAQSGAQQPGMSPDQLAEALESDMNHYLTTIDREYYPDFSKMLFSRALIGNAFRKVYRCPLKRRPVSVWVRAQDMIISNDCSHLAAAGRVTERIKLRQSTMRRLMVVGHFRDIPLVSPTGQANETELAVADAEGVAAVPQLPEDFEHTVYECYCELGSTARNNLIGDLQALDRDENRKKVGYPLPYRVSIDLDSRAILEIRRNWKKGDPDHRARQRYVKYGFIPGLGFWDLGLIHIVGNPTQAATMIQRSMVDSGLFANFPGGLFLKQPGSRQTNTVIRPNPGEFIGMEAAGAQKIQDMMMPLPYKPPGPEMLNMVNKFEADGRRLAGVIELPIGEGRTSNVPVGTIMAYIESVSMVPGAVHKDDHITQQQEFELLRELFAEEPASLTAGRRGKPARQWQIASELMDPDLVPAADPNTPSQIHRLMKKQAMIAVGGMPQFQGIADQRAIYTDVMEFLTGGDPSKFTIPPQPQGAAPPDPKIVAAELKAQSDKDVAGIHLQQQREANAQKSDELQLKAVSDEADRQSEESRAALKVKADLVNTMHDSAHKTADRAQDHAHHVDEMQNPPNKGGNSFAGSSF